MVSEVVFLCFLRQGHIDYFMLCKAVKERETGEKEKPNHHLPFCTTAEKRLHTHSFMRFSRLQTHA